MNFFKHYKNSYLSYFLMYFFFFFCLAFFSGFISVYLMDQGYSASQVSFVVSCSFILSVIVQPFIGKLNDQYESRYVNSILLLIAGVSGIIFIFLKNIYLIALVYSLVLAITNGTNPIIERMAILSRFKYGSIRVWATIGYAVATIIAGSLYKNIGPYSLYVFFAIGELLCVIGILGTHSILPPVEKIEEKVSMVSVFKIKHIPYYLIIVCLFYGITNVHHLYLPAMLKQNGLPINNVSTVIFFSTLSEVPVILLSRFYMNCFSNKQLLMSVFVLLFLQFFTFSFISSLIIQIIIVFLTKTVATMAFVMINLRIISTIVDNARQNTALSLVSACKSFSSILFQMFAGYLIDFTGYQMFYFVLFICSVVGIILVFFFKVPTNKELKVFH
nr:MFS transporter [uncultured Faecalibacillus sp.]